MGSSTSLMAAPAPAKTMTVTITDNTAGNHIKLDVVSPDGTVTYQLGVVCRGEENKLWAAATPSGSMKTGKTDLLDMIWRERVSGDGLGEVEVIQTPDPEGDWLLDNCSFTYGGCQVKFRQKDKPWGTLELTINATAASTPDAGPARHPALSIVTRR